MIRALTIGILTATAMSTAVAAADLIVEESIAEVALASYDWTGFYVGVQAGVAHSLSEVAFTSVGVLVGDPGEYDQWGGLVGVHAGALAQFDMFVLGIEGDIAWTGLNGEDIPYPAFVADDYRVNISALASIRAKAGVALDRALIYVTAGLAAAEQNTVYTVPGPTEAYNYGGWVGGWTAGAGISYAATDTIIVTGEYRATVLDAQTGSPLAPVLSDTGTTDTVIHTGTLGVSFKF